MTQSVRFQDIVQHPSSFIRGVELFASFNPKNYTLITTQGRSLTLNQSLSMSRFVRQALIASQIALFPLTLIALIFKAVWRSFHSLQIKAVESDRGRSLAPLSTNSPVTNSNPSLKKEDYTTEPSSEIQSSQPSSVVPLSDLMLSKDVCHNSITPAHSERSILSESSSLPTQEHTPVSVAHLPLNGDVISKPLSNTFNYQTALASLKKEFHNKEILSSWLNYTPLANTEMATYFIPISAPLAFTEKLLATSSAVPASASQLPGSGLSQRGLLQLTTQLTAFPLVNESPGPFKLSLIDYLAGFRFEAGAFALALSQSATPSSTKLLTDPKEAFASAPSSVAISPLSASENSTALFPPNSSEPKKLQDAVLSIDLQQLAAPFCQQLESILNSHEALHYLNHPPHWLKQLLNSSQIQSCQNLHLDFFNGTHSQLITLNLQSKAPSDKAFPLLAPALLDDEMTLAQLFATSLMRHHISQRRPLPENALALQDLAHNKGIFSSTPAPTSLLPRYLSKASWQAAKGSLMHTLLLESRLTAPYIYRGFSTLPLAGQTWNQRQITSLARSEIQKLTSRILGEKAQHRSKPNVFGRIAQLIAAPASEAEFTSLLQQIAYKATFADYVDLPGNYLSQLNAIRSGYRTGKRSKWDREWCSQIYNMHLLPTARGLMQLVLPAASHTGLTDQLKADLQQIDEAIDNSLDMGIFRNLLHKAGAKTATLFDPHAQGHLPFLVGSRVINGHSVLIHHHPVPTVEKNFIFNSYQEVAPEYLIYLEKAQAEGKRVFYDCLLNPHEADEALRLNLLFDLADSKGSFEHTLHFARFPMDGPLLQTTNYSTLQSYAQAIHDEISAAVSTTGNQRLQGSFIFTPHVARVVEKHAGAILHWAQQQFIGSHLPLKQQKMALMGLFCTSLKDRILYDLKIDAYNNSCKDPIDRGAVHLVCDLVWQSLLSGSSAEAFNLIRVLTSFPAFMAKTQSVLKHGAKWLYAFINWSEQQKGKLISKSYHEALGLQIHTPIAFDEKGITLNQSFIVDFFAGKELMASFPYELYPMVGSTGVKKQTHLDLDGLTIDPASQDLLNSLDPTNGDHQALLYVLHQLTSQSCLSYALQQLINTYQTAVLAPTTKHPISVQWNEVTQRWRVLHEGACFAIKCPEPEQLLAEIHADIEFSFMPHHLASLSTSRDTPGIGSLKAVLIPVHPMRSSLST